MVCGWCATATLAALLMHANPVASITWKMQAMHVLTFLLIMLQAR